MIALKEESVRLLRELRLQLEFCERAGLDVHQIERCGYDPNKDGRLTNWRAEEQVKIGTPVVLNYAVLKDGSRVDVPIPWKEIRDKYRADLRARIEARQLGRV
jgi:hypothetical protein